MRSPNVSSCGYAPRSKSECLSKIIPLGEKHLRRVIGEYMVHYHVERNHQGLDSHIIHADENVGGNSGDIKTRARLGGILNFYVRPYRRWMNMQIAMSSARSTAYLELEMT